MSLCRCKVIIFFIVLIGYSSCFASGGCESLKQAVSGNGLIFEARVVKIKRASSDLPNMRISVINIKSMKGFAPWEKGLLRFHAQPYGWEQNGIRAWCIVPQSGKERDMKEGESWIFFSNSLFIGDSKELVVRRAEPVIEREDIYQYLLQDQSLKIHYEEFFIGEWHSRWRRGGDTIFINKNTLNYVMRTGLKEPKEFKQVKYSVKKNAITFKLPLMVNKNLELYLKCHKNNLYLLNKKQFQDINKNNENEIYNTAFEKSDSNVSGVARPYYSGAIDYILKTGRLWGISKLEVNGDSVTLVDAVVGYGAGMEMSLSKVVLSETIKPGKSCTLRDGDHATVIYKLKKIKADKITFFVTETFDARSFGKGITTQSKTVTISPYKID